jgi:hypothetical protein
MKRILAKEIGPVLVALLICGAALGRELERGLGQAADGARITFGSNLLVDPCGACSYSEAGGYFVWGLENCTSPGRVEWLAVPFISAATGIPERISAPIILSNPAVCPTNKVTLSIYTDACYPKGPGTPLVSGVATAAEAPCDLAVARLRNAPTLTKGTKYWIVATTNGQQAGLDANWYGSNNAQYANNLGNGWEQFPGGTPAFMVQGSNTVFSDTTPDASHPAFGGNLFVDPCTGCNYDSNAPGFDVRGPENCTLPSQMHWEAVPFVAAKSGVPKRISASIILHNPTFCPENKVTLSLYTDNCGAGPGTLLVSGVATVPAAPCELAVAKLRNGPSIVKGTKYWVVATTSAQQADLDASWHASNRAQLAVDLGIGWVQISAGTPAFMVQ